MVKPESKTCLSVLRLELVFTSCVFSALIKKKIFFSSKFMYCCLNLIRAE